MPGVLSNSPSESRGYVSNRASTNSFVWYFESHSLHQYFTEHVWCGRPFNKAFNVLFFFMAGGSAGDWTTQGLLHANQVLYHWAGLPGPKRFQFCPLHIITKLPLGKLISSNHCCRRGIPGVARNQPANDCSSARNATSASRYLPHPLVRLTTLAASSQCNNL